MRKCIRCNIIFYSEERARCLYCDSLLMSAGPEEATIFDDKSFDVFQGVVDFLTSAGHGALDRKQYIIGSYFRSQSFYGMHILCRNDLKAGKAYSRVFIRPINLTTVLSLPWLLINIIDTIFFHVWNIGFCEKCQCKYRPQLLIVGHQKDECEYNQEYSSIVHDIMNGRISKTEDQYKQKAKERIAQGKSSAYQDLCAGKSGLLTFFDIVSIWITICLALYGMVSLVFPPVLGFFKKLEF